MKPAGPFARGRKFFPETDYCFHAGLRNWGGGFSSPSDGEDRSKVHAFHRLSRDLLIECARERARETVVFGIVVLTSAWPVIYMVVTVVKLLLKGRPLN
jgi:hypothetical protein